MQPIARSSESKVEYDSEEETDLDTSEPDSPLSARIAFLEKEVDRLTHETQQEQHKIDLLKSSHDALRKEQDRLLIKSQQLQQRNKQLVEEHSQLMHQYCLQKQMIMQYPQAQAHVMMLMQQQQAVRAQTQAMFLAHNINNQAQALEERRGEQVDFE